MAGPPNSLSCEPKQPSSFLSKYCYVVPTAISSLGFSCAMTPLDATYEPGCFDVVCGRGKGSYNRPGNKRFRALIATYVSEYQRARTKVDKSAVLNGIVDKVRSYINPDTGRAAQFVKHNKRNGWVQIGDDLAREKVGHALREAVAAQAAAASASTRPSADPVPGCAPPSFDDTIVAERYSFAPLLPLDSLDGL